MLIQIFRNRILFILALLLSSIVVLNGQVLNPVKWTFESFDLGNDEYELVYKASMEKDWTVYSQFTSDDGPVPTYIEYENLNGATLVGKSTEEGNRKEGIDKLFEVNVIKFLDDKPFVIRQKIKQADPSKKVQGYLSFMACDKTKCLPPKDIDFEFDLSVSGAQSMQSAPTSNGSLEIGSVSGIAQNDEKEMANTDIGNISFDSKSASSKKMKSPVKWFFSVEDAGNEHVNLIYRAEIDDAWNVYSQFTSDDGPVPTYIEYEELNGNALVGESIEKGHKKEGPDPLFDNVNVIKFLGDEDFIITQKVKKGEGLIKGYLTYMTCDASHCKMPTDVNFQFDPNKMTARERTNEESLEGMDMTQNVSDASSFTGMGMNLQGNVLDQAIPTIQTSYKEPLANCGTQIRSADGSYWSIFLGGFIGGLLAILLPCIFPMIPITVSFFTKDTKSKGWVNGLVYALSIIAIFVSIGLAVTAALGPEALNQLSTNWIANVVFFLIFIAFAISFFGYFEITLPSSWSTRSDQMADKGGYLGTFFMAATLAIVSFSCTGPIIGTALVQVASSGNYMGPFMIMLGFSVALAIPFGLFAAFPAWLNSLPRSGSWMNSVKVVLGFLELALALKFLSVADMTSNWGVLKYELFMGLWVIIFAAMTAYLFGYIKFPHDSPLKKLGTTRKVFAFLSLAWTLYMASGFMIDKDINSYSIPKAVSGITPPASYNFFLTQNELDPTILAKYPSYTKCANDINCFKDYYDGIAYANEVNKPVLLDFTGYGCVNCRKTEDYIWKDPGVKKTLNDDYVLVSLYVDDRKKLKDVLVAKMSGTKLRNVGNKWADFQIVNFEQNSQPLYVPMTTDQRVISAPRGYEEGVENYQKFLDCGLAAFKEL